MTADEFFGLASQHRQPAEWIARQVSEAWGWEPVPDYLVRDHDRVYGKAFTRRLRAMGIRDRPTAPRSPWQNGYAERLIGSIRRERLDHVIVLRRAASAACAALVPAVLQRHSDTSCVGQELTANEVCPGGRKHSAAGDPRRIAPSLRPTLISDSDRIASVPCSRRYTRIHPRSLLTGSTGPDVQASCSTPIFADPLLSP